jgi:hypothetical protein
MLPHVAMVVFMGVVNGKETVDEVVLDVALVAAGVTSHPSARVVSPNQDLYEVSTPKH